MQLELSSQEIRESHLGDRQQGEARQLGEVCSRDLPGPQYRLSCSQSSSDTRNTRPEVPADHPRRWGDGTLATHFLAHGKIFHMAS